jgi:hypothetical protein
LEEANLPMKTVFDVVDLLQLQEIWVRRPIVMAFARLEQHPVSLPCPQNFSIKWLTPRLALLRNSSSWQHNQLEHVTDPAQLPLCEFSDDYLNILYPESEAPAALRQSLFQSVYNHFVITRFQGELEQTRGLLGALATARSMTLYAPLTDDDLPLEGSSYWIPVDLVDEIRLLDTRYKADEIDTPATYVIADEFWPLLVKATPDDINNAVQRYNEGHSNGIAEDSARVLNKLADVARAWNRSPSVVGLYYQIDD